MGTISIRFATNDIRDLSDGALPVEVWTVHTARDGTTRERHTGTATKRHTIARHTKRAAAGLCLNETKHVEIRTPKARIEAFTILTYNDANNFMTAIEWVGDLPQHEADKHGFIIEGWTYDYSQPPGAGLWLASGLVKDEAPTSIEWRRLTSDEVAAVGAGEWPLPSAESRVPR